MEKDELQKYMQSFVKNLRDEGLAEHEVERRVAQHYTNTVIRKYDRAWMDEMWDYIYKTITEVPGGYWQIVDNMDYMPEFEHPRFKCLKSHWQDQKVYK